MSNLQLQAIVLVLLTLSAGGLRAADAPSQALQILEQLQFPTEQKRQFTEQQFNPMLKTPIESRGTVWITADQTMVMELSQPRPEQRRLRGVELSLSRPRMDSTEGSPDFSGVNHRLTLKPNKPSHLILLAAGALLQGNQQWVIDHFNLSYAPRDAGWEILMVPNTPKLQEKLPWIRLTGIEETLSGLRADRGSDGWQELAFFALTATDH